MIGKLLVRFLMALRVQKYKKHDTSQNKWNKTHNGIPSQNATAGHKNLVLKLGTKNKASTSYKQTETTATSLVRCIRASFTRSHGGNFRELNSIFVRIFPFFPGNNRLMIQPLVTWEKIPPVIFILHWYISTSWLHWNKHETGSVVRGNNTSTAWDSIACSYQAHSKNTKSTFLTKRRRKKSLF